MRGLSVADIVVRSGIDKRTIERALAGTRMPTVQSFSRLASALQVRLEDLLPTLVRLRRDASRDEINRNENDPIALPDDVPLVPPGMRPKPNET